MDAMITRKPIVAGNWKMNKTPEEAKQLVRELMTAIKDLGEVKCEVIVCPPAIDIPIVNKVLGYEENPIKLGAQNVHYKESGAFTGEISPLALNELCVSFVIVGHSERRAMFGETDETVNKRAKAAIEHSIVPIICVGETEAERESGSTEAVLMRQVRGAYDGMTREEALKTVIAYEPVWAIGTGKTATSEDANETIGKIRAEFGRMYDAEAAESIRILYGGSMNAGNAKALMAMPNIDGGLIGGASLKAADFTAIIASA